MQSQILPNNFRVRREGAGWHSCYEQSAVQARSRKHTNTRRGGLSRKEPEADCVAACGKQSSTYGPGDVKRQTAIPKQSTLYTAMKSMTAKSTFEQNTCASNSYRDAAGRISTHVLQSYKAVHMMNRTRPSRAIIVLLARESLQCRRLGATMHLGKRDLLPLCNWNQRQGLLLHQVPVKPSNM